MNYLKTVTQINRIKHFPIRSIKLHIKKSKLAWKKVQTCLVYVFHVLLERVGGIVGEHQSIFDQVEFLYVDHIVNDLLLKWIERQQDARCPHQARRGKSNVAKESGVAGSSHCSVRRCPIVICSRHDRHKADDRRKNNNSDSVACVPRVVSHRRLAMLLECRKTTPTL